MTSTARMSTLEVVDGIAVIRITGHCRFGSAVALVTTALEQVRIARHGLCLIEGLELRGFGPPSVAARLEMVRAWAEVAGGVVVCALVVRREWIDHEKIGMIAARNRGFHCDVFEAEDEARAWLLSHAAIEPVRRAEPV